MDFFRISSYLVENSSLSSPGPGHLSLFSKKTKIFFSFQLSYSFVLVLALSRPLENTWIQVERIVVIFRKVLHDYSALQVRRSRCSHSIYWKISGFPVNACIELRRVCHNRLKLNFFYAF